MRYTKQNFSVELIGNRYGHLWNDVLAFQKINFVPSDSESLTSGIKALLATDFQDGKLCPDAYLKITLIKPNRRVIRYFDVTLFNSLSHMIGDREFTMEGE